MGKELHNISVNTDYIKGEPIDTQAIRLVEAALNLLSNDYQKVRILQYHIQKINDKRSAEAEASMPGVQEMQHGPAR